MQKVFLLFFLVASSAWAAKPYDPCRTIYQKTVDTVFFFRNSRKSPIRDVRNVEHGVDLEQRIRFYQSITGRTATEKDVRRARIATSVLQSLKFDRKFSTIDALQPLFLKMHLAYHLYLHNERLLGELAGHITQLRDGTLAPGDFWKWIETNKISETYLTRAEQKGDLPSALAAAKWLERDFEGHTKRLMKVLSANYDEYEASRSMLEACAKFTDEIGKNAAHVLERLSSDKLLDYLFKKVPISEEHRANPSYAQIKNLIKSTPEMADHRRWWIGTRELFAAILSLSPTDALFYYLDRAASNIPWVNKPRFRAVLQFLQSERAIIIYYPDIQRIIEGSADPEMKLEMLEFLNSPTNDVLLNTFARRLDARKTWHLMKEKAEAREDKSLHEKMLAAEEARKVLGELVLWHHPRVAQGVRSFLDLLVFSGGGYLAATKTPLGGWVMGVFAQAAPVPAVLNGNDPDDDDKKAGAAPEATAPELTEADEKERDELVDEFGAVMEAMAQDPEAKPLVEAAKNRSREASPENDNASSSPSPDDQ